MTRYGGEGTVVVVVVVLLVLVDCVIVLSIRRLDLVR